MSRIETGKQPVSPDDIRELVGQYDVVDDVVDDEIEKYVAIARQAVCWRTC